MKLKDLKKKLDKMSKEELEQSLAYNSEEYSISGGVSDFKKASSNLYWTGDDDPSKLYTRTQLIEEGYSSEDIEEMVIEIPKGQYYLEL